MWKSLDKMRCLRKRSTIPFLGFLITFLLFLNLYIEDGYVLVSQLFYVCAFAEVFLQSIRHFMFVFLLEVFLMNTWPHFQMCFLFDVRFCHSYSFVRETYLNFNEVDTLRSSLWFITYSWCQQLLLISVYYQCLFFKILRWFAFSPHCLEGIKDFFRLLKWRFSCVMFDINIKQKEICFPRHTWENSVLSYTAKFEYCFTTQGYVCWGWTAQNSQMVLVKHRFGGVRGYTVNCNIFHQFKAASVVLWV